MKGKSSASDFDYQSIIENSPDYIMQYDRAGRHLYVNRVALQIIGAKKDHILNKNHRESGLYSSSQCDFWENKIGYVFETGNPVQEQFEWQTVEGSFWLDLRLSPEYDDSGEIISVLNVSRDITELKQTEQTLHETEEIFNNFLLNSPIYIFFKDSEIRSLRMSKNFENMLGQPLANLLGKTMDDLFPSALAKQIIADDMEILNKGKFFTVEEEFNGRIYTTSKFPIYIDGKPKYLAGYAIDITDRKLLAEAKKESEIYFSEIFEKLNIGVGYASLNGKLLVVNRAIENIFELSREKIVGKSIINLAKKILSVQNIKAVIPQVSKLLKREEVKPFKIQYKNKILEVSANSYTELNRLIVIVRDITEISHSEEEIRKIGKHYQSLIEKAPDGIVLLDSEAKFKYFSPSSRKIFGYSKEDVTPIDPSKLTHPDDFKMVLPELTRVLQDPNYIPTLQYRFADKYGNWIWVESTFSNLLADPNVESIVINFRDITERKLAEKALKDKADELERFNNLMLGREMKMIELKMEINELLKKAGGKEKYRIHE